MEVKDIIKPAVVVSETDTFATALRAMTTKHTNTLLVVNEEGLLTGEVTVADLLDAVVPSSLNGNDVMEYFNDDAAFATAVETAKDVPVADFMSVDYSALSPTDGMMTIVATAITHARARIPVVDRDGRPVGIISRQGLKSVLAKYL